MKKLGIVGVLVVIALTGCSATEPEPTPTPTETASANAGACEDFADLTMTVPTVVNGGADGAWENLQADFDAVALTAEDTVKERMLDLSEDWPDYADIKLWNDFDEINSKIAAVERACNAEGSTAAFAQFTTAD